MIRIVKAARLILIFGAMFVVAACQTQEEAPPAEEVAPPEEEAAPPAEEVAPPEEEMAGESLTIALPTLSSEVLDPVTAIGDDKYYLRLLYSPLIGTDRRDQEICPCDGLATDWSYSDDGLSLSLTLREGVMFHNGEALTAEDVKFSIERLGGPDDRSVLGTAWTELIESIEVTGDHALTINLNRPSATFLLQLSSIAGFTESLVVPKDYFEEVGAEGFAENPIGSGPYKLVDRQAGSFMEFERFDDYFLGLPTIETITLQVVPEESTRIAMLETGDADIIDVSRERSGEVGESGYNLFVKTMGDTVVLWPHLTGSSPDPALGPGEVHPDFHEDLGPNLLLDKRVLTALNMAVNRDEIVEFLMDGKATVIGNPGFSSLQPDFAPYPYDPVEAKRILDDAGYAPEDLNVTLYVILKSGFDEATPIGEAIADSWGQIGVTTDLVPIEWGTIRPRLSDSRDEVAMPSIRLHSYAVQPFFTSVLDVAFSCEGSITMGCDPELDAFIDQALESEDLDSYNDAAKLASAYAAENGTLTGMFVMGTIRATNDKVTDWDLGGTSFDRNYRYIFLEGLLD